MERGTLLRNADRCSRAVPVRSAGLGDRTAGTRATATVNIGLVAILRLVGAGEADASCACLRGAVCVFGAALGHAALPSHRAAVAPAAVTVGLHAVSVSIAACAQATCARPCVTVASCAIQILYTGGVQGTRRRGIAATIDVRLVACRARVSVSRGVISCAAIYQNNESSPSLMLLENEVQTPAVQCRLVQSDCRAQVRLSAQPVQLLPPQSTSDSSPSFWPLLHDTHILL